MAVVEIYYDAEFTGLHQNTTPISMGFVAETGETFYAEFTDYAFDQCNQWIKDNVLSKLACLGLDKMSAEKQKPYHTYCFGSRRSVGIELEKWLLQFDNVQIISDVPHYDWVLFCQLWGNAFNIPSNVSKAPHDLNQDIAMFLGISEAEAFDINREKFCGLVAGEGDKHNALWDAKVAKACRDKMRLPRVDLLQARKEALAELAHTQWSGWMEYLFEKSTINDDGTATIPKWAVDRWTRQINTSYSDLSEQEKNSDREEADKIIALLS